MELDTIKKAWKEQKTASFSRNEILAMLRKKSSSVAKLIFYISMAELLFGVFINFILPEFKYENNLPQRVINYTNILLYVNYIFIIFFIVLFFLNYKRIKAENNISQLLTNIINTRKTVQYYIIYNLAIIALLFILATHWLLTDEHTTLIISENIKNNSIYMASIYTIVIIITLLVVTAMYFFYRLLYGFLLRRLKKNYSEIKQLL